MTQRRAWYVYPLWRVWVASTDVLSTLGVSDATLARWSLRLMDALKI